MIGDGLDPERALELTIATDNACLDGLDRKTSVIGLHMCRGNNRSAWLTEGSYDAVAEKTFSALHVDRLLLEYDDEQRTGGFEVLRFVPPDVMVVLGIVSSKLPELESVDTLRRRIDKAARYHAFDKLAISPQCGFASTAPGNLLTWDDQRRKLELLAETAQRVWG
jgi:5-methyltetrahydropteroyltriglutamate--homocysteine methyltransferase